MEGGYRGRERADRMEGWREAGRERADRMEGWREEGTEGESE